MRCPYCKAENPPSADKCGKCGKGMPVSEATFVGTGDAPATATPPVKTTPPLQGNPQGSAQGNPQSSPQSSPQGTSIAAKTPGTPGTPGTPQGWSISSTREPGPVVPAGEFAPGTMLGERYEIISQLGQGGMGAVYKARDTELERLVALKIIRPELTTNPEMLKRFKQELILARQVTHRNVIRIFDLGQADGFKFITMEFLEGQDLRAVLREKGKLAPEDAAKVILQICRALEAAHGEGVIHRDLKPQNIMMDANGRAYVMDFGIARSDIGQGDPANLPRARSRPWRRRDSPRPETAKHHDGCERPGLRDGFWHRAFRVSSRHDADRRSGGDAGIYVAGTSQRRKDRRTLGSFFARCDSLRAGCRKIALLLGNSAGHALETHPGKSDAADRSRSDDSKRIERYRRESAGNRAGKPVCKREGIRAAPGIVAGNFSVDGRVGHGSGAGADRRGEIERLEIHSDRSRCAASGGGGIGSAAKIFPKFLQESRRRRTGTAGACSDSASQCVRRCIA